MSTTNIPQRVYIPDGMVSILRNYAKKNGFTFSGLIVSILRDWISKNTFDF